MIVELIVGVAVGIEILEADYDEKYLCIELGIVRFLFDIS